MLAKGMCKCRERKRERETPGFLQLAVLVSSQLREGRREGEKGRIRLEEVPRTPGSGVPLL